MHPGSVEVAIFGGGVERSGAQVAVRFDGHLNAGELVLLREIDQFELIAEKVFVQLRIAQKDDRLILVLPGVGICEILRFSVKGDLSLGGSGIGGHGNDREKNDHKDKQTTHHYQYSFRPVRVLAARVSRKHGY